MATTGLHTWFEALHAGQHLFVNHGAAGSTSARASPVGKPFPAPRYRNIVAAENHC